jgi:SAM-dependent methyltransferase
MSNQVAPPTFAKHPADTPTFWDLRYEAAFTPWSQEKIPHCWRQFLNHRSNATSTRILVPGCGEGFEVADLVRRGYHTTAIDFSQAAINSAKVVLGDVVEAPNCCLKQADFFDAELCTEPFDLVYERAFLCALPPKLWPNYAAQMAKIIKPRGLLVGFFCYDPLPKGPPFGLEANALESLLDGQFQRIYAETPTDSISVFVGREKFEVWQKTTSA